MCCIHTFAACLYIAGTVHRQFHSRFFLRSKMSFENISDDEEGSVYDLSMKTKNNNEDFEKVFSDILDDLIGGGIDLKGMFDEIEQSHMPLVPQPPPSPPSPSSPISVHNDHSYNSDEEVYRPSLTIRQLSPTSFVPSDHGPGIMLYSSESVDIIPMGRRQINTGIGMCIPTGYYGEIISVEYMVSTLGVVVLSTMCAAQCLDVPVKVSVLNTSAYLSKINIGDPIAVLVLKEAIKPKIVQINF